jgi:hypothetical protein
MHGFHYLLRCQIYKVSHKFITNKTLTVTQMKNNYLFVKNKVAFFPAFFFELLKRPVFSSVRSGVGARVGLI